MDLPKAEKLQDLLHLGSNTNDTTDADDDSDLGFSGHEEISSGLGSAAETDLLIFGGLVLLDVGLSALEDVLPLGGVGLLLGCVLFVAGSLESSARVARFLSTVSGILKNKKKEC